MKATVSPDGKVKGTKVVSGVQPLAQAAAANLSKWLFIASSGSTGDREAEITFVFSLSGVCDARDCCPGEFTAELPDRVVVTAQRIRAIVD